VKSSSKSRLLRAHRVATPMNNSLNRNNFVYL
jgi:hypothetical protein